jgi:hypothetical protein
METKETREPEGRLTGKEGSPIDIKVAAEWTRNHRHRNPRGVISQFFGKDILNKILQQPDCIGIRFYYANSKPSTGWQRFVKKCFKKSEGEVHLIISGVTMDGMDQLPGSGKIEEGMAVENVALAKAATGSILGEQSVPCPGGAGCPSNVLTGGA